MVEWKKIKDICKTITPPTKIATNCYSACGNYPIIDQGQKDIVGYTDNELALLDDNKYILFGDHTRFVKYYEGRFAQGADGLKILITRDGVENKYFFYAFSNIEIPTRGYSRHWSIAKELEIPIPSKEEQTRIVGILDTFTDSIANLKEQIKERRKQYEYYRDQLLDLEGKEGVEMKTLGEICEIRGRIGFRGYTREDQVSEGEGVLSLSPGNIVNGKMDYKSSTYITWHKYEESPEIKIFDGDILFCKTGSTVGKVSVVDNLPYKATINPQLVVLKEIKTNSKFLAYTLATFKIQLLVKGLAGVGSVPNISQAKLNEILISIPSKEEQTRIVETLDQFEAVIANLEAQLKAREKQYEYYRNKLLTFE